MRSFWSGAIAFGLVTIPAKLYVATRDLTPHFHWLHKECGTPIVTVRRCPKHKRDLTWDEIGKGYEVSKGKFVLFTAEELAKLEADEEGGTIELVEFVDPLEVDAAYVENSYWVAGAGKSTRGYDLLRQALDKRKKVALAKVRLRTRTRLALLRPRGPMFALDILRFAEELVPAGEVTPERPGHERPPTPREMALALNLVDDLAGPFDPQKHPDAYRSGVQAAARAKAVAGEARGRGADDTRRGQGGSGRGAQVIDLTHLLEQSLKSPTKSSRTRGRHSAVAPRARAAVKRAQGVS